MFGGVVGVIKSEVSLVDSLAMQSILNYYLLALVLPMLVGMLWRHTTWPNGDVYWMRYLLYLCGFAHFLTKRLMTQYPLCTRSPQYSSITLESTRIPSTNLNKMQWNNHGCTLSSVYVVDAFLFP